MKRVSMVLALGILAVFSLVFLAPLALDWVFFSGRIWPRMHLEGLRAAAVVAFAAAHLAIVAALAATLRRAFGIWRLGAALWALAAVASGLWPLAALLPASIRFENRPAVRFSTAGGAALLATAAAAAVARFAGLPLFWPIYTLSALGTALVLAAAALSAPARLPRSVFVAFAAILAVSLATQPALRAGAFQRKADARLLSVLERIGSPIRPGVAFPGVVPAIAEADDPVATSDEAERMADEASFNALREMIGSLEEDSAEGNDAFRRHPFQPEEIDALGAWFASHSNLAAAAEATSAPGGYRSCLPGVVSSVDIDGSGAGTFLEPRLPALLRHAGFLALRCKSRLAGGDTAGAAADLLRLDRLAAIAEREPMLIGAVMAGAFREIRDGVLFNGIDRWSDETLETFAQTAAMAVDRSETGWKRYVAGELVFADATLRSLPAGTLPATGLGTRRRNLGGAARPLLRYWFARERLAFLDFVERQTEDLEAALARSPGPDRAAAFEELHRNERRRVSVLPPGGAFFASAWTQVFERMTVGERSRAEFVRAAVAVERWRRTHGGECPPSLETLVESGALPSLPRDGWTDEPLAYDPGPLHIPEETVPALADPDVVAYREFETWTWDDQRIETVLRNRIGAEPGSLDAPAEPRRLSAATTPGFRLYLPPSSRPHGRRAGRMVDFPVFRSAVPSPAEEKHAESAEAAELESHAETAEGGGGSGEAQPPPVESHAEAAEGAK